MLATSTVKNKDQLKLFGVNVRDGPISVPNTRYYRYQDLEEKYRILARNIDCFDTAEPAIFSIVASGRIMKMIVMVVVESGREW